MEIAYGSPVILARQECLSLQRLRLSDSDFSGLGQLADIENKIDLSQQEHNLATDYCHGG
jgi:hypothetical protein